MSYKKRITAILVTVIMAVSILCSNISAVAAPPSVAVISGAAQNKTSILTDGVRHTRATAASGTKYGGSSGIEFNVVEIDMSQKDLYLDTVYGGERSTHAYITGEKILSNFKNKNSELTPVAAINADLWWMYTGSATEPANNGEKLLSSTSGLAFSLGFTMSNGEIYTTDKMPQESFKTSSVDLPYTDFMAFGITLDSIPVISNPDALVTIKNTTKNTTATADGINRMPAYNALVMYTDKGPINHYANDDALEIVIDITSTPDYVIKHGTSISGKVVGIYDSSVATNPTMDLNSNRIILTARGDRKTLLSKYAVNDVVKIDVSVYDQWGKYTKEWQKVTDAVSGHIPFAVDGAYHTSIGLEAGYPATIIGINNSGNVVMLTLGTTSTGRKGISVDLYDDLAKDLDLRDAFLLDGGGSSQMYIQNGDSYEFANNPTEPNRQILNMLVLSKGPARDAQGKITQAVKSDSTAEVIDFSKPSNMFYINGNASVSTKCTHENGAVKLTTTSAYDPYITFNYMNLTPQLSADKYKYIVIEYMLPKTNSSTARQGEVFLQCGSINYADGKYSKITDKYTRSGEYEKLVIDVSKQTGWSGAINGFRFDYFNFCKTGDVMYIKSITLTDTKPITTVEPTATPTPTIKPSENVTESLSPTETPTEIPDATETPSISVTPEITEQPNETETPSDVYPEPAIDNDGLASGAIVGIAVGGIVLVGAVTAVIIILVKKKKK